MIAGASVDRALQVSTGRADTTVAVLDVGVIWDDQELDTKTWLNTRELPDVADRNGNGVVDVLDFCGNPAARFRCDAADALVADANPPDLARGRDTVGNGFLDGQDILLALSDGVDDDRNGYVDDVVGWDFFDDDNDPFDASSHSSAANHGNGRAREAAAETNNGQGSVGSCPRCTVMHLRLWDTFIPDSNNYAAATVYAADQGAAVTEVAQGAFSDTSFAKRAHAYAWDRGTLPVVVSSDLNTAHHDYPASDDHVLWVNGLVADTEPLHGLPPNTWFRQANLTQYGAHAHVGIGGDTGSQATGKAAGVAALALAHARDLGIDLSANQLKQLVTLTAEDVLPENTLGVGVPDPSQPGWDQYFGYGRIDARALLDAITARRIPPEVFIDDPTWFRLLDPDEELEVRGEIRGGGPLRWQLQAARGIEPRDSAFATVAEGTGNRNGRIATLPAGTLRGLFRAGTDFGRPPTNPDEFDVTFRLVAVDADGVRGEDRRMGYVRRDPTLLPGWPLEFPSSIAASPRLWDLDRDGDLEILLATDDGTVSAHDADGTRLWTFTGDPQPTIAPHAQAPGIRRLGVPSPPLPTPAIADLDGDLATDIVVADAAGRIYRLTGDGELVWRASVDPALSAPPLRTRNDARATGIIGAPSLGDVDGDGDLEIVAGALDGHLYVWDDDGTLAPGYPLRLAGAPDDPREDNDPKIIVSVALGDLDPAHPGLEIVVPTNEYLPGTGDARRDLEAAIGRDPRGLAASLQSLPLGALNEALGGPDNAVHAVHGDGTVVDGWPARLPTAIGNALPLIGPSIQPALGDLDDDGALDVFTSAVSGETVRIDGGGTVTQKYAASVPGPLSDVVDRSGFLQFLEYPALGDLDRDGRPEALKGGLSLNALVNLVAVGQNLPQNHVFQAWDGATGEYLPAFPRAIADWELLTAPAVAPVADGGNAALVGNALYFLDAFGADGRQPAGWPKFTGGWMTVTPAVGDLDGDGSVEIVAATREGYVFAWSSTGAAAENDEWWTFHHDERATGTHGSDTRPPATITDAQVRDGVLTFTAPGDDWHAGQAVAYEIRVAPAPVTSPQAWAAATALPMLAAPAAAGTVERIPLPVGAAGHVAVVAVDEAGNRSQLPAPR
jgi:hypothetical protein